MRRAKEKRIDHFILVICMFLFIGTLSVGIFRQYQGYLDLKQEQTKILAQIKEEQEKKAEYENNKEYYQSDAYIEKVAREQLGLLKSNEVLYINRGK